MPRNSSTPSTPDWNKIKETLQKHAATPKETDLEKAVRENYNEIQLARQNGYNTNEICDWLRQGNIEGVYSKSLNAALKKEEKRRGDVPKVETLFTEIVNSFALSQPEIEVLKADKFYLMQGKESAKVITIQSVTEDKVQYQIYRDASNKSYSNRVDRIVKNLRGPIPEKDLESVVGTLENRQIASVAS